MHQRGLFHKLARSTPLHPGSHLLPVLQLVALCGDQVEGQCRDVLQGEGGQRAQLDSGGNDLEGQRGRERSGLVIMIM